MEGSRIRRRVVERKRGANKRAVILCWSKRRMRLGRFVIQLTRRRSSLAPKRHPLLPSAPPLCQVTKAHREGRQSGGTREELSRRNLESV